MTERAVVLLVAAAAGVLFLVVWSLYRRRAAGTPERLNVDELGLELVEGCCAFVVFTTPACRPCKTALAVVGSAAEESSGLTDVRAVDAIEHHGLATRYGVRGVPTVFLITASGHVVRVWRKVPEVEDVRAALAAM